MSGIYGCLNLTPSKLALTVPALSITRDEVKWGYHLAHAENQHLSAGLFMFSAPETSTIFVPSRKEKIDAGIIGKLTNVNGLPFLVRQLLLLNKEKNNLRLADIVYERLYKNKDTNGHYLATISQTGPHSKLIFMSKGIKMYMIGVTDATSIFLVWSNESDLETRMRQEYNNKYHYYRFPYVLDRCLVLQTQFIYTKLKRWQEDLNDKLKVFSALEHQIFKAVR